MRRLPSKAGYGANDPRYIAGLRWAILCRSPQLAQAVTLSGIEQAQEKAAIEEERPAGVCQAMRRPGNRVRTVPMPFLKASRTSWTVVCASQGRKPVMWSAKRDTMPSTPADRSGMASCCKTSWMVLTRRPLKSYC